MTGRRPLKTPGFVKAMFPGEDVISPAAFAVPAQAAVRPPGAAAPPAAAAAAAQAAADAGIPGAGERLVLVFGLQLIGNCSTVVLGHLAPESIQR